MAAISCPSGWSTFGFLPIGIAPSRVAFFGSKNWLQDFVYEIHIAPRYCSYRGLRNASKTELYDQQGANEFSALID